jgi:hypothetical protein
MSAANESTVRIWAVDVPVLGRAVDVLMDNGRAPSAHDLIWSLDAEEDRRHVQDAHYGWTAELRETPARLPGTGGTRVRPGLVRLLSPLPGLRRWARAVAQCWDRDLGCVMRAGHTGSCVPGRISWKSRAAVDALAEPLRVAGVEHALVQHERHRRRWRLEREVDHRVPDSGRWVRRWTPHNTEDTKAWLAVAGYTDFDVECDKQGPLLMVVDERTHRRPLHVAVGEVLRLEDGRITVADGGWVNCGRPVPAVRDRFPFEWPLR